MTHSEERTSPPSPAPGITVVIELQGGVVHGAVTSHPGVRVVVVDHDGRADPENPPNAQWEGKPAHASTPPVVVDADACDLLNQDLAGEATPGWLHLPMVRAEVHDDAGTRRVDFDARPFFGTISRAELTKFMRRWPQFDEATDAIAEDSSDPEVRTFFRVIPDRQPLSGETNGFGVSYSAADVIALARVRFPDLTEAEYIDDDTPTELPEVG